jgi:hypothetical protein
MYKSEYGIIEPPAPLSIPVIAGLTGVPFIPMVINPGMKIKPIPIKKK